MPLTLMDDCCRCRERFGSFTYAAPQTPYTLQLSKCGSSGVAHSLSSSKLSQHQKTPLDMEHSSSYVAHASDSHPAVKLVVKLSSASNKQPSIVSKTANALKLRYSSIISTRRASAAAAAKSQSVGKQSAITMISGCKEVTDCIVNVERFGSRNTATNAGAAVNCNKDIVTIISNEPAVVTSDLSSSSKEQSEQNEVAECGSKLHPDCDDVLLTNNVSNPDTTEIEDGKQNKSLNDAAVTDALQCQNHYVTDRKVEKQSITECQVNRDDVLKVAAPRAECRSVDDDVAVDGSDKSMPSTVVDDNYRVVTSDHCQFSAPCTDLTFASSTDYAVSSDKMNIVLGKNSDEGLEGAVECSSLSSSADVDRATDINVGQLLSVSFPVTTVSSDITSSVSIQGSVSRINAVVDSTVTSLQVCHTAECDMEKEAEWTSGVLGCNVASEDNSTSDDKVSEQHAKCLQSACDRCSLSECSCDNIVNLMSVDEASNGNNVEMECSHMDVSGNDVMVAGTISTGTDFEHDSEDTLLKNTSTVCHDSQPLVACAATATNQLHSADTATSVPCSTPASQLSTSATDDNVNVTVAASHDSAVCSYALSTCLVLSPSSPLSWSGLSPASSVTSHVMFPGSQGQGPATSESLSTGMSLSV